MSKEQSAGAIVFRMENGQLLYLLLHYHSGHWEFARGHFEEGEDEMETVRREVKEETGIDDLQIVPGFKGFTKFAFKRVYGLTGEARKRAPWVVKVVTLYVAQTEVVNVKISSEHKGYGWFAFENALKKLPKDAKKVFTQAHEFLLNLKHEPRSI